jgi:hypothetical protein
MVLNYVFIIMCIYVFVLRYCTISPVYVQLKWVTEKATRHVTKNLL